MARKELADLRLSPKLQVALETVRDRLTAQFEINRIVVFGSAAWGRPDEESDVDVLIVLEEKLDLETEDRISRVIFEINPGLTLASRPDFKRLAHQDCHPEPFGYAQDKLREGSRSEILRYAQNDAPER